MSPCVIILTGPPAAGKSSVSDLLAKRFDKSVVIPIDDVREWVKAGYASSVDWTDETERQFQMAEEAVCEATKVYLRAGFTVILDHCRNLPRWDVIVSTFLADQKAYCIALAPSKEVNLARNLSRTSKDFDSSLMVPIIDYLHEEMVRVREGWLILDSSTQSLAETEQAIWTWIAGH